MTTTDPAEAERRWRENLFALVMHDIKNQLAIIRSNVDFCRRGLTREPPLAKDEERDALDDADLATRTLERLTGNLLDTMRAEAGQLRVRPQPIDLRSLLLEVAEGRRRTAARRGLVLSVHAPEGLTFVGDPSLLLRVLENILDNAVRYARREIRLEATATPGGVSLAVGNDGPPVPAAQHARVFARFERVPGDEPNEYAARMNLGLGLYFCRLAAQAHGGDIRVDTRSDMPTTFVLDLPSGAEPRVASRDGAGE